MNIEEFLKQLLSLGGFSDYKIEIDSEHNHGVVFIHTDPGLIKENLPIIVESLNHLLQLLTRKNNLPNFHIDVNNYRKERENLIAELAKATARKVVATKQEAPLHAMNSYERRIAHMELAAHPEVKTESVGKGAGRCVIVKPIT